MLVDPSKGAIDFADGTLLQVGFNSHATAYNIVENLNYLLHY